jgi:hypothetical protein
MKNLLSLAMLLSFGFSNAQTKIRQGDGTYSSNKVLYTIDGNKIRQGDGTYSSNKVLFTIDGSLSITKIACLLYFVL